MTNSTPIEYFKCADCGDFVVVCIPIKGKLYCLKHAYERLGIDREKVSPKNAVHIDLDKRGKK